MAFGTPLSKMCFFAYAYKNVDMPYGIHVCKLHAGAIHKAGLLEKPSNPSAEHGTFLGGRAVAQFKKDMKAGSHAGIRSQCKADCEQHPKTTGGPRGGRGFRGGPGREIPPARRGSIMLTPIR